MRFLAAGHHPGLLVVRFDDDPRHNMSDRAVVELGNRPDLAEETFECSWVPHEVLPHLERTIAARKSQNDPSSSYTAQLLNDPSFTGEKVQEEAEEVARAGWAPIATVAWAGITPAPRP